MPDLAYRAEPALCSQSSGHREGPRELRVTTLQMSRWVNCPASINIYLVYLFTLALGLCIWGEIHEERML